MALRLNGSTSGYAAIDAPAVAGSNTLVLPTGNGTNGQFLQTNGSGAMSWGTVTSSKILQVVQTLKTDTFSTASNSFVDITGLTASITPSSSSNKILVTVSVGSIAPTSSGYFTAIFRVARGGSAFAIGDAASTRPRASFRQYGTDGNHSAPGGFSVLDAPSTTSSIIYSLQVQAQVNSTVYINRSYSDPDTTDAYAAHTASVITLMEVAP